MPKEEITYARAGYLYSFLKSSKIYFNLYNEYQNEYLTFKKMDSETVERFILEEKAELAYTHFCTAFYYIPLFLEAYIYDYGARRLGDNYFQNYLDKLDFISKWIVVPKLITGKQINKSRKSFEILKRIVTLRNNLIHHKTKNLSNDPYQVLQTFKPLDEVINMNEIYNAIIDIFTQLDEFENSTDFHLFHLKGIII